MIRAARLLLAWARLVPTAALLLVTMHQTAQAASTSEDPWATSQRTRYSSLCRARKDIDSCSDAVRWGPGDPALIVALADALARAGRVPEALRDYRRAKELEPTLRGIDEKIDSALTKSTRARVPKSPPHDRPSADPAATKHYSNDDPEGQSH